MNLMKFAICEERSVVSTLEACEAVLLLHSFQTWKEAGLVAQSFEREKV